MPTLPKFRLLVSLFAVAALLAALPAAAQATLVFTRNPINPVVFKANDNGSGLQRVGSGFGPKISPDGETIVFFRGGYGRQQQAQLMAVPTAGGPARVLARNWQNNFVFAWSADSQRVATVLGPELGTQRLTVVDVASGKQTRIASGFFNGVSFAPEGSEQLVYARAPRESYPPRTDVFRVDLLPPGAVSVAPVQPQLLTNDRRSQSPLWGPNDTIVFVRLLGANQRKYGPKNELFTMNSAGAGVKRLTHTKVDPLTIGLTPTAWSASGNQLLASFGGQDTSYAVAVNPRTGGERPLTAEREVGFIGTALSNDGASVLGWLGGFEPGPNHRVVSIPYAGGRPTVLVRNATEPDWDR
jgi:Tol biopolymer transport system component